MGLRHCIAACLLAACLSIASVARAASVTAEVGRVEGRAGETVTVPITLKEAVSVQAMHLELIYDPAVLEAVDAVKGKLAEGCPIEVNKTQAGRIIISLVSQNGIEGDG